MNKKCVILAGGCMGEKEYHKNLLSQADYIICADSGACYALELGIRPHLVVGDFDSLPREDLDKLQLAGVETLVYPRDKDFTDTHLALKKALEMGFKSIDLLAATGSRLDHSLANITLLAASEAKNARLRLLNERQEAFVVREETEIKGEVGQTVSLLPLSPKVSGIKTRGLKYQVLEGVLEMGNPIGVSNELTTSQAWVSVEEGLLLVVLVRKKD